MARKRVKDMTPEEKERHEEYKRKRKIQKEHEDKVWSYIFDDLKKASETLNELPSLSHLPSVSEVKQERKEVIEETGPTEFSFFANPDAYDKALDDIINKIEPVLEDLKKLRE